MTAQRIKAELPLGVGAVVIKALERDRDARYQSAREMEEACRVARAAWLAEAGSIGRDALGETVDLGTTRRTLVAEPTTGKAVHTPRLAVPPDDTAASASRVNPEDGLEYVWVPAGTFPISRPQPPEGTFGLRFTHPERDYVWMPPFGFQVGGPLGDGEFSHEEPACPVTISKGFWLSRTRVTQAAYQRVMGFNPSESKKDGSAVTNVTWDDAKAYCLRINGRLPTEAEWEHAEIAKIYERYHPCVMDEALRVKRLGSVSFPNRVFFAKAANFGDWVADWFGPYEIGNAIDPSGPSAGSDRVLRGPYRPISSRGDCISYRGGAAPTHRNSTTGFRCVLWIL